MREHPIPQDITGYRFHIIGSMTLKQFLEIAIGVVFAGIIYSTNLPAAFKWPLVIFFIILGGMAAFLPIEERPLDHWIITFIRAMYRPTQFFWKREATIPEVFNFTVNKNTTEAEFEIDLGPVKKERIKEYLTSVPSTVDPYAFEPSDVQRMSAILDSFASVPTVQAQIEPAKVRKPQLEVRVRSLRPQQQENVVYQTAADGSDTTRADGRLTAVDADAALIEMYQQRKQLSKQQKQVSEVAQEIAVPETENIHIVDPTQVLSSENPGQTAAVDDTQMAYSDEQAQYSDTVAAQGETQFNVNLPFPEPPTEPNKLVGMVLSPTNELITNAIVEILKADGTVARAVKTNALGQFFVTTPLESGQYVLVAEKDGLEFEPKQLELNGEIVKPIEIRSLS